MVSWRECLKLQTQRELTEEHKEQKMMRLMQKATCLKTSLIGYYAGLDTSATLQQGSHPCSSCKAVDYHMCFDFRCKAVHWHICFDSCNFEILANVAWIAVAKSYLVNSINIAMQSICLLDRGSSIG
jgi:hypothetical protein